MFQAFTQRKTADCLAMTCEYLKEGATQTLEEELLRISAVLGLGDSSSSGNAWLDANRQLLNLLKADKIRVKDALSVTCKLCLLYKRMPQDCSYILARPDLKSLKPKVVQLIPENAKLAYTGINTFSRLLPSPDTSEFIFYSRVLASLGKLASEEDPDGMRVCLEYLSRKKLELPLATGWPAPAEKDNGDPVWLMWGFLLCFYTQPDQAEIVATNFELFKWNWNSAKRTSMKTERYGFLWGAPFCIPKSSYQNVFVWSNEELLILEQVENMALQMWNNESDKPPSEAQQPFEFVPRGYNTYDNEQYVSVTDNTESVRTIKISSKDFKV